MIRIWLGILVVLLLQSCSQDGTPAITSDLQHFQKANSYYQQKQWDSAIHYYELCISSGSNNPAVYYDMGNAWYRKGKYGRAILAYKKALKRSPSYKAAQDNLVLAQSKVPGRILQPEPLFFQMWWAAVTKHENTIVWAIAGWFFFTIAIVILIVKRWGGKRASIKILSLFFGLWICCIILAYFSEKENTINNEAVIISSIAPFRQAGNEKAPLIGRIPEGTIIKMLETANNWVQIELPDTRTGWVPIHSIARVD